MSVSSEAKPKETLNPEKLVYWYLRLNGFLQIENFYVHPAGTGGARTDADLLAVRFPHRAERLFDRPTDVMMDDEKNLFLTHERIDIVIAEVTRLRCKLNGPWTDREKQNIHRVLAAIGCIPGGMIGEAADALYQYGYFEDPKLLRVRLVAIGSERNTDIAVRFPQVVQIIWDDLLRFVWQRFQKYRNQKADTQHWDTTGRTLKRWVNEARGREEDFIIRSRQALENWHMLKQARR
jgi:hypothetical protein